MRAFCIKYKGATIPINIVWEETMKIGINAFEIGYLFFRKKDAKKYLNTFKHKELFEVIGLTIDKSNKDNRKRS